MNPVDMKVELIAHTPNPEEVVATSAKLCYSPVGVGEIMKDLTVDEREKFVSKLQDIGHASPFEHTLFTFGIEGVSRVFTHQFVRHRIASYSQQSQRYVYDKDFEFIVPKRVYEADKKAPEVNILDDYKESCEESYKAYIDLANKLMEIGYDEKKSIESARYLLPNSSETKIVASFNARSLFNFFNERTCRRAQREIRDVADEMLRLVREVAPNIFKYVGADCISKGKCEEGYMSCGNPREDLIVV